MKYPTDSQKEYLELLLQKWFRARNVVEGYVLAFNEEKNKNIQVERLFFKDIEIDYSVVESEDNEKITQLIEDFKFCISCYEYGISRFIIYGTLIDYGSSEKFIESKKRILSLIKINKV